MADNVTLPGTGGIVATEEVDGAQIQIVKLYTDSANFISGTTAAITDTTQTALIAAQAAGVKSYLTHILVTNASDTVGTYVQVQDGNTVKYQAYAAPLGGGFSVTLPVPLVGTAATAWNVKCVTTGANVIANASGFKGA